MTPKCCKGCRHLAKSGTCKEYKQCAQWVAWFSAEWSNIRKAAKVEPAQGRFVGEERPTT